jgi:molybdopterin-guanine dinucleotide biosynthesis protein A
MTPPFSAVILTGGAARRMGSNKALLEVGGREILERELDATRKCRDVILATDEEDPYAEALQRYGWEADPAEQNTYYSSRIPHPEGRRARVLPDREPGLGPLAGLVGGLRATVEDQCWVLSCDLPFITPELGSALLTELGDPRSEDGPFAAVPVVNGRLQPLCAAYRREAWRVGASLLEQGKRSMRALLEALPVRRVPEEQLRLVGDPRLLLLNVNTPEDLETARSLPRADSSPGPAD